MLIVKNRPLSPHLKIYNAQFTSIFSIFHRISGSFLFIFLMFYLICLYVDYLLSNFSLVYLFVVNILFSTFLNLNCVSIFFLSIFYFHVFNGFRHLYLDIFCGLYFPFVDNSGIFVVVSMLFLVFFGLFV